MSTRTRADVSVIEHDNYSVGVGATVKTPITPANFIFVKNMDATNSLLISFNSGTTFFTISAGAVLSFDVDGLINYTIKSSAGSVLAECLYGREH